MANLTKKQMQTLGLVGKEEKKKIQPTEQRMKSALWGSFYCPD